MLIILFRIYINVVMLCEYVYWYICKLYLSNFFVIFFLNKCKMVKIFLKNIVILFMILKGLLSKDKCY